MSTNNNNNNGWRKRMARHEDRTNARVRSVLSCLGVARRNGTRGGSCAGRGIEISCWTSVGELFTGSFMSSCPASPPRRRGRPESCDHALHGGCFFHDRSFSRFMLLFPLRARLRLCLSGSLFAIHAEAHLLRRSKTRASRAVESRTPRVPG